jgi:hypothetical protein
MPELGEYKTKMQSIPETAQQNSKSLSVFHNLYLGSHHVSAFTKKFRRLFWEIPNVHAVCFGVSAFGIQVLHRNVGLFLARQHECCGVLRNRK